MKLAFYVIAGSLKHFNKILIKKMEEEKYICQICKLNKPKLEMTIKKNKYSGVGLNCKKCETEKVRINKNKKKESDWWVGMSY